MKRLLTTLTTLLLTLTVMAQAFDNLPTPGDEKVIDNDPAREFEGIDDQLNKAIEVILKQMKDYPEIPEIPAWPDKTK